MCCCVYQNNGEHGYCQSEYETMRNIPNYPSESDRQKEYNYHGYPNEGSEK